MLDPVFKSKWLAALRGTEYTQARNTIGSGACLCCIGVAGAVKGFSQQSFGTLSTYTVGYAVGLSESAISILMRMNDEFKKSFDEIADYIEGAAL
jgi:hypothetical protein